jgi:ankyrin repeat protein
MWFNFPTIARTILSTGHDLDYRDIEGNTALHNAILLRRSETFLPILVEYDVNPTIMNKASGLPMELAIYDRNSEASNLMWRLISDELRRGMITKHELARRLLSSTVKSSRLEVVSMLVKAGIDVKMQMPTQRTALVEAAQHGDESIASLLLQAGANLLPTDEKSKETAMHVAAQYGRLSPGPGCECYDLRPLFEKSSWNC